MPRDIIDVDIGYDSKRPLDLTLDSDDEEIVLAGTFIPARPSSRHTPTRPIPHSTGCPRGPKSTIQVTWTQDSSRSTHQRSEKRRLPSDAPRLPSSKRQRVERPSQQAPQVPRPKGSANNLGVIDFDESDDEVLTITPGPSTSRVTKSYKAGKNNSDDEYEVIHAGFDLSNPDNWIPIKHNEAKIDFETPNEDFSYTQPPPSPRSKRRAPDFSVGTLFNEGGPRDPAHIWEILRKSWVSRPVPKPSGWKLPSIPRTTIPQYGPQAMKLNLSFKKAPGGINRITQSGPVIGIATAATGGNSDEERGVPTLDPYNREGAAMIWNGSLHQLKAHRTRVGGDNEDEDDDDDNDEDKQYKQYTVNDIKFDTFNQRSVSTGKNGGIEVWSYEPAKPVLFQKWTYGEVPHDIVFKPGTSTFAVAEQTIHVYSSTAPTATEQNLRVANHRRGKKGRTDMVGAMTWGRGHTSHQLFASTEPPEDMANGWHKGFDVETGKTVLTMDNGGAGDAMAVTHSGNTLALLTSENHTSNHLRLYDIRNSNPKAVSHTKLLPFQVPPDVQGEIPSVAFRDDGIYLAIGRNDNHIHIYDARMQDRLLFDYPHHGPLKNSPGGTPFGITHLEWVDRFTTSLSSGLVTGGSDGCVRFWDPHKSDWSKENGLVIAETNSDIGYFSIGDRFKGEQELVVGDCAGEVYIFGMPRQGD